MAPLFCLDCLRTCHECCFGEKIHFILHGLDDGNTIGSVVVDVRSWARATAHFTVPALCFTDHKSTTKEDSSPWYDECGPGCSICNTPHIGHSFVQPIEKFEESYSDLRSYAREKQRLRKISENKRARRFSYGTFPASCSSDDSFTTSEDISLWYEDCYYDCALCNGTHREEELAQATEDSGLFDTYRDFRSAAREKQRRRTIRENKNGHCNSYKCRKEGQTEQRTRNKRAKREKLKLAVEESQQVVTCYTRNSTKLAKHQVIEWDIKIPEELNDWVTSMNNEVIRYTTLHQGADVFESVEPYIEVGENFTTWAQQRIAEMQTVKESRLRRHETLSQAVPKRKSKNILKHFDNFDIYNGDASITSLPTKAYDVFGHALLSFVLTPYGVSFICPEDGYQWFMEYEWAWHRNMSGCWELGSGSCSTREGDWENLPIPCPHCRVESWGVFYECYCRNFGSEPAPEEMQRCALIEWVDARGIELVRRQGEMLENELQASSHEAEIETDSTWELLSMGSSDTWSVVGVEI